MKINDAIDKCRQEQLRCVSGLLDPLTTKEEFHGLRMGLTDWLSEEILLEEECE